MFLNIELVPNIYFFKVFRSISRHIINETRRVRPLKRVTVKQSEYGKFVKKKCGTCMFRKLLLYSDLGVFR